jgi:hypothetical protein
MKVSEAYRSGCAERIAYKLIIVFGIYIKKREKRSKIKLKYHKN